MSLNVQEKCIKLRILKSKRALADAHLGEIYSALHDFSESLRLLIDYPTNRTRREHSEIATNILAASQFYKTSLVEVGEEFWKLAASEVLSL